MKNLVDIVNFNADASCLSSKKWLNILQGGNSSQLMEWLNLYCSHKKKISLGLTGSSIVDIKSFNPECIKLINTYPEVFEIIIRPFSHDIALLRNDDSFEFNVTLGKKIIENEFRNIYKMFLPPEFMLTSLQILQLKELEIESVCINPNRFPKEITERIPPKPYYVQGVNNSLLGCIPTNGYLTQSYLNSIHLFKNNEWNTNILNDRQDTLYSWRDGESPFLIPNGNEREAYWLKHEDSNITRKHLFEISPEYLATNSFPENTFKSYPTHSFFAWMEEFRMLGYLNKVKNIEDRFDKLTQNEKIIWLHLIGSDILSSVEKKSPIIHLKNKNDNQSPEEYCITRSEKGLEGEDYLYLFGKLNSTGQFSEKLLKSNTPHIKRFSKKLLYLKDLLSKL